MSREFKYIISIVLFIFLGFSFYLLTTVVDWGVYQSICPCSSGTSMDINLLSDCVCYDFLGITFLQKGFIIKNAATIAIILKVILIILPSGLISFLVYNLLKKKNK
jgi:hypothetical protein